ncbi:restriction endonuclease subunit S [uncultured Nitrosomonas sp.]|uniref:restriction endonuclease subunit S n=1 Tax=uncultured Nitrosomonas sp. TaxID=156424 RepID=UPI0025D8818E|nr:restriction endonuclease subunit S [uncultured Nitrosomonas sp.]
MSFSQMLKLSEFCKTSSGGTPSRQHLNFYENGNIPWVKSGELRENIIFDTEEKITEEALQNSSAKIVPKGSLLLAMYGATVGRLAFLGINAATNQAVCSIQPDETICFPKYLYYALLQKVPEFLNMAAGGAQPNINQSLIKDTRILLPILEEQKRIAAILDKADAIRRKRQQAIALTNQLLRSVFLDLFGDPVTNPKGLATAKLCEVGEIVTGNTPSRKRPEYYGSHTEWIKSDNINTPDHYLTTASEFLSEDGFLVGRHVPKNSILVTCIAGSHDCIGNAAIANRTVAFNQQINAIIPNNIISPLFLYAQLWVNKKLVQGASTESMKGMVSKSKFSNIEILLPSMLEQEKYSDFFLKSLGSIKLMNFSKVKFNELFNGLTQKAFSGQLIQHIVT